MQFTFTFTDTKDGKGVDVQVKRTDEGEGGDAKDSNAAQMVGAILEMLDAVDGDVETSSLQ